MSLNQSFHRMRFVAVAAILPVIGGCGLFPDRSLDYRDEPLGEPLRMPGDLPRESFQSEYVIPEIMADASVEHDGDFEIPRPPDLTGQILDDNYQVSRSGDLSWLVVNDVPGRVWPAISEFLNDRGAEVAHADPESGIQQTGILNRSGRARDWVRVDDMDEERPLVLQVRVEHGVQSRSTEIQARLVAVDEAPGKQLDWHEDLEYPEREHALLRDMADYLQSNAGTKTYSRVALNLPREERVSREGEGDELSGLNLDLAFDRGWGEVDRALDNMELVVVDRDRSDGVWLLDLRNEEQRSRGWWLWQYQDEPRINAELHLREASEGHRLTIEPREKLEQTDRPAEVLESLYEALR